MELPKTGWGVVPCAVLFDPNLSVNAKILTCVVLTLFPLGADTRLRELADACGLDPSEVLEEAEALHEQGVFSRVYNERSGTLRLIPSSGLLGPGDRDED